MRSTGRVKEIGLYMSPHMSHVMRKPTLCICENKDADQLRGNREADQRLCFRYIDSTIPLFSKSENFKPLAIFCDCTARFVSELVENQNVSFLMTRLIYFLFIKRVEEDDKMRGFTDYIFMLFFYNKLNKFYHTCR